jgi:hypothetical protein
MQGNSLLEQFEGVKIFDTKLLTGPVADNDAALANLKERESTLSREYIRLHQADGLTKEKKYLLDRDLKNIQQSIKKYAGRRKTMARINPACFPSRGIRRPCWQNFMMTFLPPPEKRIRKGCAGRLKR